jgi:nucleotide-binding universal stress UspA family protein
MPPAHVLVPLDGSPLADAALAEALALFDSGSRC